jgi:hypothetical protein
MKIDDAERARLAELIARPETRDAYADWLSARDEARAKLVRLAPGANDICYPAWLERDGHLDFYLRELPALRQPYAAWVAGRAEREARARLAASHDPGWVALLDTLGRPFAPFFFFDNHGSEREIEAGELPFAEPIGTRGAVVTFGSDFHAPSIDAGLFEDLALLARLPLGDCAYGAATCPLHPFVCELEGSGPVTAATVLRALRADRFSSKYVRDLDRTHLPYPGYHPGSGQGVDNDEIHDDFCQQHLFCRGDEEDGEADAGEVGPDAGAHGALKRSVVGGQLWYVLLHTTPKKAEVPAGLSPELASRLGAFSRYVVLFAVGRSLRGPRLIGAVTHQVCHNLCD